MGVSGAPGPPFCASTLTPQVLALALQALAGTHASLRPSPEPPIGLTGPQPLPDRTVLGIGEAVWGLGWTYGAVAGLQGGEGHQYGAEHAEREPGDVAP